nr:integrase, catalytic region, zinc finger, CCHC-type, peptidase aspartic, catalytic [Tanacetum cinerariifolium]
MKPTTTTPPQRHHHLTTKATPRPRNPNTTASHPTATPAPPESPPLNVASIERPTTTNHCHQDKRPSKWNVKPSLNKASVVDSRATSSVVQIILWYLDSGCSKHMTGDRSQLINFVQKFLGTVKFGNDHVAKIMGYGDYQIGNVTISRVYYVEGLGHNLFSVGQSCDSDLELAFRQHTCFIRNLEGVDLLTVMMWMLLRYDGWAQFKAYVSLDGFLPAKAKVLRGELLLLLLRHLRVSRTTYLPVKSDAPKITMS